MPSTCEQGKGGEESNSASPGDELARPGLQWEPGQPAEGLRGGNQPEMSVRQWSGTRKINAEFQTPGGQEREDGRMK